LHVQCSTLQKSTKHSCATRVIANPTSIGVLALTYSRLWSQFLNALLKLHKFWFCVDDMNQYVSSMKCKYALVYRNPNLRLATKARACKSAGQEGSPRVKESVRE
jgi:hypothetical protein